MSNDAERSVISESGRWRCFQLEEPDLQSPADPVPSNWWNDLGMPLGTPYLLSPIWRYDRELNEFFYSTEMLPARMATRVGYANNLVQFFNFLHHNRGIYDWRSTQEVDHLAYLIWRRQDPEGPRVSGATWDREVSAQNRFFRWQASRGHIPVNPIPQRASRSRPGMSWKSVGQSAATYSHDRQRDRMQWLPASSYRIWRDIGVRGYTLEGFPDPGFRGRWAARNAAFVDLMVRTGLRLAEQASLLASDIPAISGRAYSRFWLSAAVAKWGSARWVYVPGSVLSDVFAYMEIDRRSVVRMARSHGKYEVPGNAVFDQRSGVVSTIIGDGLQVRTRVGNLSPTERMRLMVETEEGIEPAALWLSEAGQPVAMSTWKDIFRQANARCLAKGTRVQAHAHLLRHTFAVLTLEQLQRGHIAALSQALPEQRSHYTRVFGDPLDWVRRALGHRSVTTTQVYLHALEELELETRLALIPDEWSDPRVGPFALGALQ